MSKLHVFNCDNDLALANFSPGFTPPSVITMMMEELALLPLSWADEGDVVGKVCDSGLMVYEKNGKDFQHPLTSNLQTSTVILSPWGWSPALCHRLHQVGLSPDLFPTTEQLLEIRRLSSRERAVELLAAMRRDGICADFQSVYCSSDSQVEEALSHWPRTILKAPWSSSGKGLRYGHDGREDTLRGWYQRIIKQQGGVVVEPLYDKFHDFAMEFYSDGCGQVVYQGLSLFETNSNGAYSGNLLMPEAEKQAWLDEQIPSSQTTAVRHWLESHLSSLVGTAYRGYLGVDMMVVNNTLSSYSSSGTGEAALHPMVEVNLRMTMGMASILLQHRQPAGFRGVFRLDYFARPEDMQADNAEHLVSSPNFHILASGPHYRAYIE